MRILVVVGLALIALAAASPSISMNVAINEIVPDPVDYPRSPNASVRVEKRTGPLYAWVIRMLDGAIVRKYEVAPGERSITIEIYERTNDPLAAGAVRKAVGNPIFGFTLAILNADQVVEVGGEPSLLSSDIRAGLLAHQLEGPRP